MKLKLNPAPDAMFGHQVLTPDDVILAQSHDLDLAARVVKAFNMHDQLLAACEQIANIDGDRIDQSEFFRLRDAAKLAMEGGR